MRAIATTVRAVCTDVGIRQRPTGCCRRSEQQGRSRHSASWIAPAIRTTRSLQQDGTGRVHAQQPTDDGCDDMSVVGGDRIQMLGDRLLEQDRGVVQSSRVRPRHGQGAEDQRRHLGPADPALGPGRPAAVGKPKPPERVGERRSGDAAVWNSERGDQLETVGRTDRRGPPFRGEGFLKEMRPPDQFPQHRIGFPDQPIADRLECQPGQLQNVDPSGHEWGGFDDWRRGSPQMGNPYRRASDDPPGGEAAGRGQQLPQCIAGQRRGKHGQHHLKDAVRGGEWGDSREPAKQRTDLLDDRFLKPRERIGRIAQSGNPLTVDSDRVRGFDASPNDGAISARFEDL